ncbi:TNF receptor-associated factor 3-like [Saccostrea echinata]|uniref:TNF receptor-associated factor 3-like n=1 Tax=Saccostrea echinata TaxID=191078 RepID=UPI002A8037A2|nr:TNF receptor-associated factor 3-like [Saccostrea echinata]
MDQKLPSLTLNASLPSLPHQQTPPGNPDFVSLPAKYRCTICRGVLRDAVQTLCGHRACGQCVDQLLTGNPKRIKCPANEEFCVILNGTEIHGDFSIRREVRNLEVYCAHQQEGCKEIIQWRKLEVHVKTCEYKVTFCRYHPAGCQINLPKKDEESHAVNCEFRTVCCELCSQHQTYNRLKKHKETECPNVIVNCKYNCEKQPCPRLEMNVHAEAECPKRPRFCKYHTIGCDFTGSEEEIRRHCQVSQDQHIQLTALQSQETSLDNVNCRRKIKELSTHIQSLQEILTEHSKQMEYLTTVIEGVKTSIKDIKLKAVSQTERLINVERRVENMADKEEMEKQRRDILLLKDKHGTLEQRVTYLERAGPEGGKTVRSQLHQHDRQLALMDARCAEIDLKMQVMEAASYDGVLMWKIRDYSKRKQDAKTGRTVSLYSQPFYTGRFGYKMCARVYLNGDGVGKGTHLSLFFVVQKGEYDALLPWPFKQKVTLMLLDQENRTRHIADSFRPDVKSSSFKRPNTEMNIASGCPMFVSHPVLETPGYLRDDTIFIKVVVATDDLKLH